MSDRRLAGIYVSPEFMYVAIHGWRSEKVISLFKLDWPIDVIFQSCNWVAEKRAFLMIFEHDSFPVNPEGQRVKILSPEIIRVNIPEEDNKEAK